MAEQDKLREKIDPRDIDDVLHRAFEGEQTVIQGVPFFRISLKDRINLRNRILAVCEKGIRERAYAAGISHGEDNCQQIIEEAKREERGRKYFEPMNCAQCSSTVAVSKEEC